MDRPREVRHQPRSEASPGTTRRTTPVTTKKPRPSSGVLRSFAQPVTGLQEMEHKHLRFGEVFRVVIGEELSQAAPMTLASGGTEGDHTISGTRGPISGCSSSGAKAWPSSRMSGSSSARARSYSLGEVRRTRSGTPGASRRGCSTYTSRPPTPRTAESCPLPCPDAARDSRCRPIPGYAQDEGLPPSEGTKVGENYAEGRLPPEVPYSIQTGFRRGGYMPGRGLVATSLPPQVMAAVLPSARRG